MKPSFYWRQMRRELRGGRGRLVFFTACLAVGVAAVTAVAGLSASIDGTIRQEARQILGADLAVESRQPLPESLAEELQAIPGIERADLRELVTVVAAPARPGATSPPPSQLVELKVVTGVYPFYGRLALAPDRSLAELLGEDGAVVAPELLARLGLALGDVLRVGGADFTLRGTVVREPDALGSAGGSWVAGPRVFISGSGLARTVLEGRGSRVLYRALLRLPPAASDRAAATALAERLRSRFDAEAGAVKVETYAEAQPSLRRGLRRAERFLGLVALLSLLVGGMGVGQAVRAWLASRLDAVAIWKCLGLERRQILLVFATQTLVLGLAGSLAGVAAGLAVQWSVPLFVGDLVPAGALRQFELGAVLRGLGLGTGVALAFSGAPLAAAVGVPALRVLRRDAEPLPPHRSTRLALVAALGLLLWLLASAQADSLSLGGQFVAAVAGAAALLAGAAALLTRGLTFMTGSWAGLRPSRAAPPLWLRHGVAALLRPGAGVRASIVALGLGVLVVVAMFQVETQLASRLDRELPANSPSAFLVDVQTAQWPGVRRALEEEGALAIDSVPVISARLAAIDGRGIVELAQAARPESERDEEGNDGGGAGGARRWALTREQRLTYLEALPPDNRILAGSLWSDPSRHEVSVEEEFARDLGVGLGSVLRFDVQGVPIDLVVTTLRSVDWETFGINFFLIVEPGALDDAPQSRVAAARLPPGGEQRVQDLLARDYPNVTVIRIRDVLERIVSVLRRIGVGVRFLGGFTVLAATAIFAGAVAAGAARRGREAALLKTLGMTRGRVVATFAAEYALLGLVAGAVGAAAGGFLAWGVLTRAMESPWSFDGVSPAVATLGAALLAVAAGLVASATALSRRPVEVLRSE